MCTHLRSNYDSVEGGVHCTDRWRSPGGGKMVRQRDSCSNRRKRDERVNRWGKEAGGAMGEERMMED